MKAKSKASREAVLHAFSKEANRNEDTLANYLECYPEYRESIIDLSVELLTTPAFENLSDEAHADERAKKAWLTFQSMLNPEDPASAATQSTINPLARIDAGKFKVLAVHLNVSRRFLSRLRDNAIQVETIPKQFLELLAQQLRVSVEVLRTTLTAPSAIAAGQRFKASGKPVAGQKVTFEDALATSGLTESQQNILRTMKD
ncbi:hypothetical protein [Klebsiella pneumoniae]|uniref:hypothetical protein n=1 Tax=Klebsiella pneumoniae TaxID=573 RepID=UPI0010847E83|nr:hypothetical protein [Klebsiella pneumoniae]VGC35893.1 Uncharacterised protein [Klebsiella pneumoniae]